MTHRNNANSATEKLKPSLVIFSPLPPIENGIADYCSELLPGLAKNWDLTIVIANNAPKPVVEGDYEIIHLAQFSQSENRYLGSSLLYHLGNNPDHAYIVPMVLKNPGVVVLHDLSLHHLVDQMTLRYGDVKEYSRLLMTEFGYPGSVLANQFDRYRLRERAMFYELPMIRQIAQSSKAMIVHSMYAKTKVLAQHSDVPVEMISHHLAESAIYAKEKTLQSEARAGIGVSENEILLVSLGFITKAKQIEPVLQILSHLRPSLPKFRYILAGQDHCDIEAVIKKYKLEDVVEVTGYLQEDDFYEYCIAADLIINLRYPTGGETSGTLIRALGVAACVLVVDIGPFSEFPDDVCAKIAWDEKFEMSLAAKIKQLMTEPHLRAQFSINAAEYISNNNKLAKSVSEYNRILTQYNNRNTLDWKISTQLEFMSPAAAEKSFNSMALSTKVSLPLWFRERMFPIAPKGNFGKALIVGSTESFGIIRDYAGYKEDNIFHLPPCDWDKTLSPEHYQKYSSALFETENFSAETFNHNLAAFNRMLLLGGVIVITIPNGSHGHMAHLSKANLNRLGYSILKSTTAPEYVSFSIDMSGEKAVAEGVSRNDKCLALQKYSSFISSKFIEADGSDNSKDIQHGY